jgi:large-conductance mechanosensitive channel|tara:strand:+ start:837 stop:1013 length:177 start_codon:yes stop_codon:yes gene_type:complete
MKNIFYSIGDFFEIVFGVVESIGNTINYFYIGVIFVFLVVWTIEMFKHKKNNEEHAKS